jgi:hypothetical protein
MARPGDRPQESSKERDDPSGAGFSGGYGEGVLINGVDQQAARRTHMRELTMARQAAERRSLQHSEEAARQDRTARAVEKQERRTALAAELKRIEAAHQAWLETHDEEE